MEPDDIRNVAPEELARRNAAAQAVIAKSKAMFERMQRARAPLPTGLSDARTLALLHGGMRERVATSTFRGRQAPSHLYMLPCFAERVPLNDMQAAALITFLNRGRMARAGQLAPRSVQQQAFDDAAASQEASNEPI